MARLSDGAFQFLSLCAQRPGSAAVAERLSSALATVPSFDELAIAAEHHGMEPLALAHIERTGLAVPADLRARLRARRTQYAHAAAVRTRVVADVASAMTQAGVPFLVLKGAALAHLLYGDPGLRPMRDVDLLIRKADAGRALDVLLRCGFQTTGALVPRYHHHLRGMAKTLDAATVTIELHHELLPRTPFIEPCSYDDLLRRSQPFEWSGNMYRTLGREDMLWHVTRRVPAPALGAECGTTPLPVGLVLVTSYRAGARWRPRRLTPAPTLLALMRHTVAARGTPAHSMPILKQAVSGSIAFAGRRGEGSPAGFRSSQARPNAHAVRAGATRSDLMYPRQFFHHPHRTTGRRSVGL